MDGFAWDSMLVKSSAPLPRPRVPKQGTTSLGLHGQGKKLTLLTGTDGYDFMFSLVSLV